MDKASRAVEMTVNAKDEESSAVSSDFPKDSQNSLSSGEREMDKGEANMSIGDRDGQCSVTVSEFRELSPTRGW